MSVVLDKEPPAFPIPCGEMKNGQLGVIVTSSVVSNIGRVVQMLRAEYGVSRDTLLRVGGTPGESWSAPLPNCFVRLLQPGELIRVVSND